MSSIKPKPKIIPKIRPKPKLKIIEPVVTTVKSNVISKAEDLKCKECLDAIKSRLIYFDKKQAWCNIRQKCGDCRDNIYNQMKSDTVDGSVHRPYPENKLNGNIELDIIQKYGPENGYFNATMLNGARYWFDLASMKEVQALDKILPRVPKLRSLDP